MKGSRSSSLSGLRSRLDDRVSRDVPGWPVFFVIASPVGAGRDWLGGRAA